MEGAKAMRNEDDKLDKLDGLMDRALASYTPQEARPGLEQRILASVAVASRPRPRGWSWKPAWALAAGAALVAALAVPLVFKPSHPEIAAVHRPTAAEAERSSQTVLASASSERRIRVFRARPLASEPEAVKRPAKTDPGPIEPLIIAPIHDKPLTNEPIELKPIAIASIEIAALN
jgi:hypothetical protein